MGLTRLAAACFLPLLILFLAGMVALGFGPPERRRLLSPPGIVLLLVNTVLFGNCLTVAVVHSFDIERYSYNLLLYTVLCELAAAVWLSELAWTFVRKKPTPAAPPPAPTIAFSHLPPASP